MLHKTFNTLFLFVLFTFSAQALAVPDSHNYDMRNPHENIAGLNDIMSGGQPSIADLEQLQESQFSTIINLRTAGERTDFDEAQAVDNLGMDYISIPIANAGDLTIENIMELNSALNEAEGNVLVHCASGNRVGAILALRAYHVEGYSVADALALGTAAGMTRLGGSVKDMLEAADDDK